MCDLIKIKRDNVHPGFNIYLRYSINSEKYPYSEDLHLGRLCCRYTLSKYVAVNKCLKTDKILFINKYNKL